jgi:hypothetical protein
MTEKLQEYYTPAAMQILLKYPVPHWLVLRALVNEHLSRTDASMVGTPDIDISSLIICVRRGIKLSEFLKYLEKVFGEYFSAYEDDRAVL